MGMAPLAAPECLPGGDMGLQDASLAPLLFIICGDRRVGFFREQAHGGFWPGSAIVES